MKRAFTVYYNKDIEEIERIIFAEDFKRANSLLRADVLLDAIHDLEEVYNKTLKEEFHAKISRKESAGKRRKNPHENGPSKRAARP